MRKNRTIRVLGLAAACALALAACGGNKPLTDGEAYQRFVGTWENPQPPITQAAVKVVVQPDYFVKFFVRRDSNPTSTYKLTVRKTWVDAEGGTCCQFFFVITEAGMGKGLQGLGLMRVDKAGKALELNTKLGKEDDFYPDQMEGKMPGKNWSFYQIFYGK